MSLGTIEWWGKVPAEWLATLHPVPQTAASPYIYHLVAEIMGGASERLGG